MNTQPIGNCIKLFFAKNNKMPIFLEQQAVDLWPQIVGEFVSKQTTKITAKQGVLYVTIPNAALRFELMGNRSQIVANINQKIGGKVIKGIIVK